MYEILRLTCPKPCLTNKLHHPISFKFKKSKEAYTYISSLLYNGGKSFVV